MRMAVAGDICPVTFGRFFSTFLEEMVGATGFEPATSCSQSKCSSQAELRSDDA